MISEYINPVSLLQMDPEVGKFMMRKVGKEDVDPVQVLITKIEFQDGDEKEIKGNKKVKDGIIKIVTCVNLDTMESREYHSIWSVKNRTWSPYFHGSSRSMFYFT